MSKQILPKKKLPDFTWWKENKITNVGELREALTQLPPETLLSITDADIGGYDVSSHPFCYLILDDGVLSFSHQEYAIYEAIGGETGLTYEQHVELMEEHEDD